MEYNESGFSRILPKLQKGRIDHGSSYFENDEGTKVDIVGNSCGIILFQTFLVTGGQSFESGQEADGVLGSERYLSSTELLVENSSKWIYSGELPTPRFGLRGANVDQKVIMTGNK